MEVLHTFARNAEGAVLGSDSGQHSLVEAGNWLYGTTDKAIWRIKKNDPDSFTLLHTFGSGESVAADIDGNTPHGPLVLADDGNIYGTTETSFTDSSTAQAGTLFRINIGSESDRSDDSYEQLHQFDIETQDAWPVGLVSGPSADGIHTLYGATERGGNPGDVFSTTDPDGLGTVYSVQVEIPGTLVLTSDKTEISYGESVVLTWEGLYLDTCEAVNEWEGEKAVNGTETLTPDQVGQSTYNLDCLDVHGNEVTAAVQVQVNEVEDDDTSTGDDTADDDSDNGSSGGGGSMSSLAILLLGVISLFGRFRHQRSVARA